MKKICINLIACMFFFTMHAQKAVVVSGGEASDANNSITYSIGQVPQSSSISADGIITQGVQQPYEIFEQDVLNIDDESNVKVNIKLYPNPTIHTINLSISNLNDLNATYQLFDISGKLLKNLNIETLETSIDMQDYSAGTYFLKVKDKNSDFLKSFKIIKNE